MIKKLFYIVADALLWIADKSRLTYNEINIIVYYILIPLSWTIMTDYLLEMPVTTFALVFFWAGIFTALGKGFSAWCDKFFMKSVDFLNYFNRFGGNYELNSVIICVAIPVIVYAVLITLVVLK